MEVFTSLALPPWQNNQEPSASSVRMWMDNMFSKYQPLEQSRWNQSNIDTLFYAGEQSFVNRFFGYSPGFNYQQYYFNIVQQPINMITGRQRQHRKSITYNPADGADPHTTDQYTRLIMNICNQGNIHQQYSKACELSAVSAFNLMMPYLDYTGDDPSQGQLKLKIWEFNSFLVDPFFREPDMSDAQFFWCQEYISRQEADARFGDKVKRVSPMRGSPQQYGRFYFLPENHYMNQSDLMVLSYIWYKWRRKKKRLYSKKRNQFFDFSGGEQQLAKILYGIDDLRPVEVEVPTWKLACVLNDQLMFQGYNPLGFDECPAIPVYWNYEPHVSYPDLRCRSLIRPMRTPQFLLNHKIINNNDIAAATINSGYKRKVGAVANEDNLKKASNGYDIIINDGYEMTDVEKIIPTAVPESDMALAQQMLDLIYQVSGINIENWSGQQDKQISSLTMLLKQDANLMVFQKYFDQWDYALQLLGDKMLKIVLHNWNAAKVGLMIGEEPSPHFYSGIFAKYQVIVEPGLLTPTQKNLQAQQMLDINASFGREVLPPSMIIKDMNIQGKAEIMQYLQGQEQNMQQAQAQEMAVKHAFEDAKLKELYSKAAGNIATARERHSRSDSNLGLFEERLSEITRNNALATKDRMEALTKLIEAIQKYGEIETLLKTNDLQNFEYQQEFREEVAKHDAKNTSAGNEFLSQIMAQPSNMGRQQQGMKMPQQVQQQRAMV